MANGFRRTAPILKRNSNMKGDLNMIMMIFIGVIAGVVLLSSVADTEADITGTKLNGENVTLPNSTGDTLELTGRDHITTHDIVNASNQSEDWSSNVTLSDGLGSDGTKTVILTLDGQLVTLPDGNTTNISGQSSFLNYTYGGEGYLANSSDRSLMNVTLIVGALAALVFVIVALMFNPNFRRLLGMGGR